MHITDDDRARSSEWRRWLDGRPPAVRARAEAFPPWRLFRIKQTGQLARLRSYFEDDTCTVVAWMEALPELTTRTVFGIHYDDLEPVEPLSTEHTP